VIACLTACDEKQGSITQQPEQDEALLATSIQSGGRAVESLVVDEERPRLGTRLAPPQVQDPLLDGIEQRHARQASPGSSPLGFRDMPPLSTERVRVRSYECDVYGHLNNANYVRFMRLADEAHPPVGDLVRNHVQYLRPVGPGDEVTITVEQSAADPGYERRTYVLESGGAVATTGWAEFAAAPQHDRGTPIDPAPPPPPGTFSITRPVEWRDVAMNGRVGVAALAALAEDAGIRVAAAHGWPMTRSAGEGFAIVLRTMEAEIGAPAGLDDDLRIDTFVSHPRRSMITRHYLVCRVRDGTRVCRFRSLYVWADLETNRPIRVPERFLADFGPNFAS